MLTIVIVVAAVGDAAGAVVNVITMTVAATVVTQGDKRNIQLIICMYVCSVLKIYTNITLNMR